MLARHAGLSVRAVGGLERGERSTPYRRTVRRLADAMGLSTEEGAVLEAIMARSDGPPFARQRAPIPGGGHVPVAPTPLLGRDHEVRTARRLLANGVRLLTLTGTAGVGKTRL